MENFVHAFYSFSEKKFPDVLQKHLDCYIGHYTSRFTELGIIYWIVPTHVLKFSLSANVSIVFSRVRS